MLLNCIHHVHSSFRFIFIAKVYPQQLLLKSVIKTRLILGDNQLLATENAKTVLNMGFPVNTVKSAINSLIRTRGKSANSDKK